MLIKGAPLGIKKFASIIHSLTGKRWQRKSRMMIFLPKEGELQVRRNLFTQLTHREGAIFKSQRHEIPWETRHEKLDLMPYRMILAGITVYRIYYAHDFVVFCFAMVTLSNHILHIFYVCFSGTKSYDCPSTKEVPIPMKAGYNPFNITLERSYVRSWHFIRAITG